GMPLELLTCDLRYSRDAQILRSLLSLKTVNDKPVADIWREAEAVEAIAEAWRKNVARMPAEDQVAAVVSKLKELNDGYNGKEYHAIQNGVVVRLQLESAEITDISPVRALPGLQVFTCSGSEQAPGRLNDLSPLKGLPLTHFGCGWTRVADLS